MGAGIRPRGRPSDLDYCLPLEAGAIEPLAKVERRAIENALALTKGNAILSARLLGIGRTTLYRKCKEYMGDNTRDNFK